MPAAFGEKVLAQSFGSNHPNNLILACERCNNYKKHRFLSREQLKRILVDKDW
jgi:5-methylcytosine-specific restriction endonuclease McrA